jgi:arsenate reductase
MYQPLEAMVDRLESGFDSIPSDRKKQLEKLADYVREKVEAGDTAMLNFICTHNSRRSHLAQIWTSLAAHHYGITFIETYSGGTEAMAFNPRAVAALERAGFTINNPGGDNPRYSVRFSGDVPAMTCFSKTFDHETNPTRNFAAIMTCSDADENCPFVSGAEFRLPITYRDPKESDGTSREAAVYDERLNQIATEMLYTMHKVADHA